MVIRLEAHSGTLVGFALILSVDGNAVQVVELEVTPRNIVQASAVELSIVPVFGDGPRP